MPAFLYSIEVDDAQAEHESRSPFILGLKIGYVGLFASSPTFKSEFNRDYVNGLSSAIIMEYKFKNLNAALHLSVEYQELNLFLADDKYGDSTEYNTCSLIGFKYSLYQFNNSEIYLLPSAGIMLGIDDRFVGSFYIGYEFNSGMKG